jgi:hypothetical protein
VRCLNLLGWVTLEFRIVNPVCWELVCSLFYVAFPGQTWTCHHPYLGLVYLRRATLLHDRRYARTLTKYSRYVTSVLGLCSFIY